MLQTSRALPFTLLPPRGPNCNNAHSPSIISNNETCLHVAARKGRDRMVITLMELGADPSIRSVEGTAYDIATNTKHHTTATLLKTSGSSILSRTVIEPKILRRENKISSKGGTGKKKEKKRKKGSAFLDEPWDSEDFSSSSSPEVPIVSFAALRNNMMQASDKWDTFIANSPPTSHHFQPSTSPSSAPTSFKTPPLSPHSSPRQKQRWYKKFSIESAAFGINLGTDNIQLKAFKKERRLSVGKVEERRRRYTEGSSPAAGRRPPIEVITENPLLQIPDLHKKIRFENYDLDPAAAAAKGSPSPKKRPKRTMFLRKREKSKSFEDFKFIMEEEIRHSREDASGILHVTKATGFDVMADDILHDAEEEDDLVARSNSSPSISSSMPNLPALEMSLSVDNLSVTTDEGPSAPSFSDDHHFSFLDGEASENKGRCQIEMETIAERWELSHRRRRAAREEERRLKMEQELLLQQQQPVILPQWLLDGEDGIACINVGGMRYTSTKATLLGLSAPNIPPHDNYFTSIFSNKYTIFQDETGAYFVDRDGQYFAPILTYFRTGSCFSTYFTYCN